MILVIPRDSEKKKQAAFTLQSALAFIIKEIVCLNQSS